MAYKWEGQDILAPLTIQSNQTVWSVEKLDKSIDRSVHPAQRWELSFAIRTNENENNMFMLLAQGMGETHTMMMPSVNATRNSNEPYLNAIEATAGRPVGSSSIVCKNRFAAQAVAKRGAFVQFNNHSKIYAVTSDFSAEGNTTGQTLNIFPSLRQDVTNTTKINFYDHVNLKYYLDDSTIMGISFIDGVLSGVDQIKLLEAV